MRGKSRLKNAYGAYGGVHTVKDRVVTAETTFTPAEANGTVETPFIFDVSAHQHLARRL